MWTRRETLALLGAPAILLSAKDKPQVNDGIQIGDPSGGRAIVWSRTDRPAQLMVEYSTSERFTSPRRVAGPAATSETDFTARVDLADLPPGQTVFVRAWFEASGVRSDRLEGSFRTPPRAPRNTRLLWSGDCAGQGWGINPDWGGFRIYETMLQREPDLFLHSGDTIYADNPIQAEVKLADGTVWRNTTTEAKSKIAESLDDFRGNYRYNLMDVHLRRFSARVPQIWQWDDHEVTNNWSPSRVLGERYREQDILSLASRGRQAFLEYAPLRLSPAGQPVIYRSISYGPLLDVFLLDMRSYRGPNTYNRQEREGPETAYLGAAQIAWLKQAVRQSRAAWKIIAADMPISLQVSDGRDEQGRPRWEASANGDGPPLGRELEIAGLLRFFQQNRIRNTVWLTADTHYTAAHYFDPAKARFIEFDPFWEFVSGPMHAGTFGPNAADDTFGMQVVFQKAPPPGKANLPPSAGLQFFGEVNIDAKTRELTVILRDLAGAALFSKTLAPA